MILHTLSAPPSSAAYRNCLGVARGGDALLLLGDGVYAALESTQACNELLASGAEIYLLADAARAAGVHVPAAGNIRIIDMAGFVELTERFVRQQAWY